MTTEYSPERAAQRQASLRYWMAKGCSEWKAIALVSRYGWRPSHKQFYVRPRQ
ncbi:MAG: hypothetical protein ABIU84_01900 [Thermoanaerobaculia bacterium]